MAKSSPDYEKLDIPDLRMLIESAQAVLARKEQSAKRETIRQIKALALEQGISRDELSVLFKPERAKAPVKFRNPKNAEETWSGRGKRPRWLQEALKSGRSLEEFRIA